MLNVPATETNEAHPLLVKSLFSLPLSGVIRIGLPQDEGDKVGNFWEQNWLNRLQIVWFECSKHQITLRLGEFLFPNFSFSLSDWPPQDEGGKVGNFWEQNWLNRLQMV